MTTEFTFRLALESGAHVHVMRQESSNGTVYSMAMDKPASKMSADELRDLQRGIDKILDDQEQPQ